MHAPMSVPPENSTAVPRRALATCVALVAWLSVLEWKILERLYADPSSREFVLESVRGVLAGTPVSRSWQHRFLAPLLVSALPGGEALRAHINTIEDCTTQWQAVADYLDALGQQMDRLPAATDVDADTQEQEGLAA